MLLRRLVDAVVDLALPLARELRALVDRPLVERLAVERLAVERPVLLDRELVDERPVLFDPELRVLRRPEPPLELDPDPPLLACGICFLLRDVV